MCPQLVQAWCEAAPDLAANCPPFTVNTYVCLHRLPRARLVTPGLTSDCPLQLDTVRSLISQSSPRTLVQQQQGADTCSEDRGLQFLSFPGSDHTQSAWSTRR